MILPQDDQELQLLKAAIESAGEAVVITDRAANITYVNPAFERITGWRFEEVLGKNPHVLNSQKNDPEKFEVLWDMITRGQVWHGLLLNQRKDGSFYNSEQTITPVLDNKQRPIGYISVHRDVTDRLQLEQELKRATEERLQWVERELHQGQLVQQQLYPQYSPSISGWEISGSAIPATELCGDYFDFLELPDQSLAVVVADVSGHGLAPALLMTSVRGHLHGIVTSMQSLDEIAQRLNRFLFHNSDEGQFLTMFLLRVLPHAQGFQYVGAGHEAYLLDCGGQVTKLNSTSLLLGLLEEAPMHCSPVTPIRPGEMIIMMTDGVAEAHSMKGTLFGVDRALQVAMKHRQEPAAMIVERIFAEMHTFTGNVPPVDDATVVVLKAEEPTGDQ